MANGLYGTMIPTMMDDSKISNYVDIYYCYSQTRNSTDVEGVKFTHVAKEEVPNFLKAVNDGEGTGLIDGLYNLKLPSNIFGRKGFYTIYIKPREVPVKLVDVSILKDFPNVRGAVLDLTTIDEAIRADASVNNGLVGYRMLLATGGQKNGEMRIVTSNNKCQPVTNVSTTNDTKSWAYQYNENSTLTFVTFTPSTALSFKANSTPYIGTATQEVYFVNTLFEPVCIELEMVSNDADTLATMIGGSQLRDLNNGLITTFDDNNNIFMQHEMSTLKKTETGVPQYEIREKRVDNIDYSQTLSDKIQ